VQKSRAWPGTGEKLVFHPLKEGLNRALHRKNAAYRHAIRIKANMHPLLDIGNYRCYWGVTPLYAHHRGAFIAQRRVKLSLTPAALFWVRLAL
jgi:hypothetical protein